MAYTLEDVLGGVRNSRQFFLQHLKGLSEEQWNWKPYPECKNVRETLLHMIGNDRLALESMQTDMNPGNYEAYMNRIATELQPLDNAALTARLAESNARLCDWIAERYKDAPLDTPSSLWFETKPLGSQVAYISSEDFYHAGQVAYIRQATDPNWDYYSAIYGA